MRRLIPLVVIGVFLCLPSLASAKGQLLYSITSGDITISGHGNAMHVSVPAKAKLSWFTDRPARRAGTGTAADLAAGWVANGFDRTPPNAALVTKRAGTTMQTIVTLRNPTQANGRIGFTYRVVPSGKMLGMRTGGRPAAGQYVGALFVDDATTPPCSGSLPTAASSACIAAPGTYYVLGVPTRSTAGTSTATLSGCSPDGSAATATVVDTTGTNGDVLNDPSYAVSVPSCAATPAELGRASKQLVCFNTGKRFPVCNQYTTSLAFTVSAPMRLTIVAAS